MLGIQLMLGCPSLKIILVDWFVTFDSSRGLHTNYSTTPRYSSIACTCYLRSRYRVTSLRWDWHVEWRQYNASHHHYDRAALRMLWFTSTSPPAWELQTQSLSNAPRASYPLPFEDRRDCFNAWQELPGCSCTASMSKLMIISHEVVHVEVQSKRVTEDALHRNKNFVLTANNNLA